MTESATGVVLPDDNVIDAAWAKEQLSRVDVFSQELLNFGRGEIFFMLQTNLSASDFELAIEEIGYTVPTAIVYISYLQKRSVLEAIKAKYFVALSLSAAEYIPDNVEDALALMDVCAIKFGKPTEDNLRKAAEATGTVPKKVSDATFGIEAAKKEALKQWLYAQHDITEEAQLDAQILRPEGRLEFNEKMLAAFDRLEDWTSFHKAVVKAVVATQDTKLIRFLSDFNDAAPALEEFIRREAAHHNYVTLKAQFENEVYPVMQANGEI